MGESTSLAQNNQNIQNEISKRRQIDWLAIEAEYIHGNITVDTVTGTRSMYFPTQRELAEKYQIDQSRLAVRCREEKWVERRELYKQKIKRRIGQERVNSLMSESARYDAKNLIMLDKIYEQLEIWLDNESLAQQSIDPDIKVSSKAKSDYIKNLEVAMNLLNKGHVLVRNIMGEPINAEKVVNELLELQKLEEAELNKTKSKKNNKKKINSLLKSVESRQEVLEQLMQKKRAIESQMEDLNEL